MLYAPARPWIKIFQRYIVSLALVLIIIILLVNPLQMHNGVNDSVYRGSSERLGAYTAEPLNVTPLQINQFIISRPSRTSATVTNDRVYFGSESGILYAFDKEVISTLAQNTEVTPLWTYESNSNQPIVSTATVDLEGNIYFGGLDHTVYTLDRDGVLKNQYETEGGIYSSPLLVDGVLYIGSLDGYLYALNANDLTLIWRTSLQGEIWSSPAWGDDGRLYVGSRSNSLFSVDAATGDIVWEHPTGGWVDASPAVFNGRVYVGSHDGTFYALNASDGSVAWEQPTGQLIYASAAIGVNFPVSDAIPTAEPDATPEVELTADAVYVTNFDGEVFAFNLDDGSNLWQASIGGPAYSSPVYVDGLLYVITEKGGLLHALDATFGAPRWTYVTGREGDFRSASPVPYEDKLYIASNSEGLLVLGADSDAEPAVTETP